MADTPLEIGQRVLDTRTGLEGLIVYLGTHMTHVRFTTGERVFTAEKARQWLRVVAEPERETR